MTKEIPLRPASPIIRGVDIFLSLAILGVAALPMILVAALIKLDDRGPVFFLQRRVGQNRRPFSIVKFRTMTHDPARATGATVGEVSQAERDAFQTTSAHDPRITRIGRVLRPIHMDELPQVLNVLAGHMSFVGVRPDVPVQEIEYTPDEWVLRHHLRPGITGLAQVDPSVDSMAARTARDLEWVREHSLALYFRIFLATFAKVLKRNSL